jgi:Cu(I)/Ag(I) efflux system protein CusF
MNFLKNKLCLSAVALIGLAFISHASAESHMSKKPHHEASSQEHHNNPSAKGKAAMGEGVIHSVSPADRKVNLTHEPIPLLNWPAMTMDLDVAEGVDLQKLTPGDNIQFHIELGEDKVYRITEVIKSEAGHQESQ